MDESNEGMFSMDMTSPLTVFAVYAVLSGVYLYMVKNTMREYNDENADRVFKIHSMMILKWLIIMGILIYGLCKSNLDQFAWIVLFLPVILCTFMNYKIFTEDLSPFLKYVQKKEYVPPPVPDKPLQPVDTTNGGGFITSEADLEKLNKLSVMNIPTQMPDHGVNLQNAVDKSIGGLNGIPSMGTPVNDLMNGVEGYGGGGSSFAGAGL